MLKDCSGETGEYIRTECNAWSGFLINYSRLINSGSYPLKLKSNGYRSWVIDVADGNFSTQTNGKTDGGVVSGSDTHRMRMRLESRRWDSDGLAVRPPVDRSLLLTSVPTKRCSIIYCFRVWRRRTCSSWTLATGTCRNENTFASEPCTGRAARRPGPARTGRASAWNLQILTGRAGPESVGPSRPVVVLTFSCVKL